MVKSTPPAGQNTGRRNRDHAPQGEAGRGRRQGNRSPGRRERAPHSPEARVGQLLLDVIQRGQSLDQALPNATRGCAPGHRGLIQAMSYEVLRQYEALAFWRDSLLDRPLPAKAAEVSMLLLVGLERVLSAHRQTSRAVNATVQAVREIGQVWATGLVNAVLRRASREFDAGADPFAPAPASVQVRLPEWLYDQLAAEWGEARARQIGLDSMTHPPMTLRLDPRARTVADYLETLEKTGFPAHRTQFAPHGVQLESAVDVDRLPGFVGGEVSVQDEAAQWVVELMAVAPGMQVLDACSAPGGKTLALLQSEPELRLTAVDIDPARLARVQENLERGRAIARLIVGDAAEPAAWWDGQPYDRILADVPCSATGVIRRHPDIKRLRREADIAALVERQRAMVDALWPMLKPGGQLIYATCSILKRENADQVEAFVARHPDARALPLAVEWGQASGPGRQAFPTADGHDGFFYAVLEKRLAGVEQA